MATIKDVAEKCGVSTATVSKALNGYSDVGEETAQRIREAAQALSYRPNMAARTLKTNHTNNLGVLFIDRSHSGLGHEYFSSMLESFKARAETLGYDITFISQNLGGKSMSYLEHCRYRGCDGVMIASVDFDNPQVLQLVSSEIPVVTVDHLFNDRTAIMSDNVRGMDDLTSYIASQGHREIAFVHGEDTSVTRKRLAGFHTACQRLGIAISDSFLIPAQYHSIEASRAATRALLQQKRLPTCIIYPDDFSYIGGMNELERAGLKIPADISAAGYDGIALSQAVRPRLTTLRQDTKAIGTAAADQLISAIEQPKAYAPQQIIVPGELLTADTVRSL